jgi:SAM-dependent methyltransferase
MKMQRPMLSIARLFALLLAMMSFALADRLALAQIVSEQMPRLDVPFVATPEPVVEKMLQMAQVKKGDMLYDLGCGDGRIVITAAKQYGARGVGIDLNPQRIDEAKANASKAGVESQVKFIVGDLFQANFADADVVTLYLLPDVNRKLRPQLWKQLKVGARVVSHDFDMGPEWPPEKVEREGSKTVYLWIITQANKDAVK